MRAYLALASMSFQRAVAYPFETWSMLAHNLIRLTLFVSVWSVLLKGQADRSATVAYMVAAYFMDSINFASFTWMLPQEIKTGNIAMGLLKPMSQPLRLLWEQWGENVIYLAQSVPIYTVAWALIPVAWPSAGQVALFAVSAILGNAVYVLVQLAVATVSFWTLRTNGTVWLMFVGWSVLSGRVVPLWFMPGWLSSLAEWSPFSQPYFAPAAILTGAVQGEALAAALGRQMLWVVLSALAVQLLWSAAVRRVVVQGG